MTEETKRRVVMRPCGPTCSTLTAGGRCPQHLGKQAPGGRRYKTSERYGADWRRLVEWKKSVSPFCEIREHCNGAPVQEIDHIIPIEERPDLRLDPLNVQSACKSCHSAKTAREMNQGRRYE